MQPNKVAFLFSILFLTSCATSTVSTKNVDEMSCSEIMAEMHNLETTVATNSGSDEINRTVDTGTTVAAQGASLAGVPYVGSVISIGKTFLNHNKKSAAVKAKHAEERLYTLKDAAYYQGCL